MFYSRHNILSNFCSFYNTFPENGLNVETERDDVAILEDIFFSF